MDVTPAGTTSSRCTFSAASGPWLVTSRFFFFNDSATTEIYTLSLHDALPILTTVVLALAELLARFGSGVSEVAVAVFVITIPSVSAGLTWKVSVTPKVAFTARTPVVQSLTAPRLQLLGSGSPGS